MLDLIQLLPQRDKELMTNYIYLYGAGKKDFIGLDAYLENWSKSNQKLYKLLGNQFQVEFPFECEKDKNMMTDEIYKIQNHKFLRSLNKLFYSNDVSFTGDEVYTELFGVKSLMKNEITNGIVFRNVQTGKEKKLPKGMKLMRAYQTIINTCINELPLNITEWFEDFRIKHSLILNDKIVKGTMVISIHPFDFLTMSDNNSDWTSCMSWIDCGCYHVGTVEMMNSNNVVCVYLKSNTPFYFTRDKSPNENYVWNNKKWRQLVYVTKDILVGGKAYPYNNKNITVTALDSIKKLAIENLHWNYQYGPELYLDMKHINSSYAMERNRAWMRAKDTFKHNILFDTKGMYNDMLNCNSVNYWCYRNKVKKTKIISYSGKAPCACCGNEVLEYNEYNEEYNDRYYDTSKIVCQTCHEDGECRFCGRFIGKHSLIKVKALNIEYNEEDYICPQCASNVIKKCNCCGGSFYVKLHEARQSPAIVLKQKHNSELYYTDWECVYKDCYNFSFNDAITNKERKKVVPFEGMKIIPAYLCPDCLKKDLEDKKGLFTYKKIPKNPESAHWLSDYNMRIFTKEKYTEQEILEHPVLSKLILPNLEQGYVEELD